MQNIILMNCYQSEKMKKMLLTYEKMEQEWFCFIQDANFYIIIKQLLI